MPEAGAGKLGESARAFAAVFANPNLRRVQLGWAGSNLGTWAYGVALAVFAYGEGGATAVGLVGLMRWLPAAAAAPFMGVIADRHSRRLVMVASDLTQAVAISLAAVAILAETNVAVVYVLVAIGTVVGTAFRPAQAALVPKLSRTPLELTASNVVSSTIESAGMFAGPAIGGLLLVFVGPGEVFFVTAAGFVWSALLILAIRTDQDTLERSVAARPSVAREIAVGFNALFAPRIRLLMGLFFAQTLIAGALAVLEVVIAIEVLGKSQSWVGVVLAAFGVGGLVGAVVAGALVGRQRLAFDFGIGIVLWGMPLTLIAIWPNPAVALVAFALMGLGNTLVDVSGFTLMQRSADDAVLARVFAVFETFFLLTVAAGAMLTPLVIHLTDPRITLAIVGSFLPILMILSWRRLRVLDRESVAPIRELALLRAIPLFAPLPEPTLERLAKHLQPHAFAAGMPIFDQGDSGDVFYVVATGRVEIVKSGERVLVVEPGGYFGEIALLHDVPRQAGAVAMDDVELYSLDRDEFVGAVTGHAASAEAASVGIGSYGLGSRFAY